MRYDALQEAVKKNKQNKKKRAWQKVVTCMAAAVVFCTTYALILPAITMDAEVTCGTEEHQHTEECYIAIGDTQHLNCTLPEHTHDDIVCYIDTEADVEVAATWEASLPEQLSGTYNNDVLLVAESQLGYGESIRNLIVEEDGTMNGYTRYGAWAEDAYGDWNNSFLAFCLNYAGLNEETYPLSADYTEWTSRLTGEGLYRSLADGYLPESGDILFLDMDGDAVADRAGLVAGVTTNENNILEVITIEGDLGASDDQIVVNEKTDEVVVGTVSGGDASVSGNDITLTTTTVVSVQYSAPEGYTGGKVDYASYEFSDTRIVGFGTLPEDQTYYCGEDGHVHTLKCYEQVLNCQATAEEHVHDSQCYEKGNLICETEEHAHVAECAEVPSYEYSYSDDKVQVDVKLPQSCGVPADAVLVVTPIEAEDESYDGLVQEAENAVDGTVTTIQLYDISFYTEENEYIPVDDSAKVSIRFKEQVVDTSAEVAVLHYEEDNTSPKVLENVTIEEQAVVAETTPVVEAEAQTFSLFSLFSAEEEAAMAEVDGTETAAAETEVVTDENGEVVTETVVTFETDGFSVFAVVEVKTGSVAIGGVVTNMLKTDQINNLDGKILVISTAEAHDGNNYAMSSAADATNNQRSAIPVTRNDNNTVSVAADSLEQIEWLFIKYTGADSTVDNDYYIRSVATGQYLTLDTAGNNVTLSDTPTPYYVVKAENYNYLFQISTSANVDAGDGTETDGRELSINDEAYTFATYGDASLADGRKRANLVLSTVPTFVGTQKVAEAVADNASPLDGKILAINSIYNNIYRSAITELDTQSNSVLTADAVVNGDTYTVLDTGLWKFEAAGALNTYYIRTYDYYANTTGKYLRIPNDSAELLFVDNQGDASQIVVSNDDGNDAAYVNLRRANEGRFIAYNVDDSEIVAYNNNEAQDNFVLSEYKIDEVEKPVTNLDDQKVAIVSVRDWYWNDQKELIAVTPNASGNRLAGTTVTWADEENGQIDVPDEVKNSVYWTFDAVDAKNGIYTIQSPDGKYLNIEAGGNASVKDSRQEITVVSAEYNDQKIVGLYATIDGKAYYLNEHGGDNDIYGGWDTNLSDIGNRFLLAREYVLKATVLSRAELRNAAMMPNSQLIIFVRQTDDAGNYHYYAINADGSKQEIYLEGEELADGAVMYTTTDSLSMRWDATGSATGDGWNTKNEVNGYIDLWAKNLSTGDILSPNRDGGYGGQDADKKKTGVASITSMVQTEDDNGWYNDENKVGEPLRAEHNAAFIPVNENTFGIDTSIASMITSDLAYGDDDTTMTDGTNRLTYDSTGGRFTVEDVSDSAGPKPADADQRNVFYVAQIDTTGMFEEEVSTDENLVAQVLSRGEFMDAALEYGDNWPFVIFAKGSDGNYYAMDSNGVAQPVEFIKDASLEAGGRVIFRTSEANMTGYADGESYNPNRILWDASATKYQPNGFAEEYTEDNWIDLWMSNVATGEYLSPGADGLTRAPMPDDGEHNPGFFRVDDLSSGDKNPDDIASYLAARLGPTDANGNVAEADVKRYSVELAGTNAFTVVQNGWGTTGNTSLWNLTGADKDVFYVAMLVDRNVTYDESDKSVKEYESFNGVEENVKMYVFNYGSAIDYYGDVSNGTNIPDTQDYKAAAANFGDDLMYRFFYRPSFSGEAIDGTNDPYDTGQAGSYGPNLYSEWGLYDTRVNLIFEKTLKGGYPAIQEPTVLPDDTTKLTGDVIPDSGYYSLRYLFAPSGFVRNTVSAENAAYSSVVLSQTNGSGGTLKTIENATGTAINSVDGKTPAAGSYNPVYNPNYAVQSYTVGNGVKTGLFQKDVDGYYYYDSKANAARYNEDTGLFDLYNYALVPGGYMNLAGGNFLPFNQGETQGRLVTVEQLGTTNYDSGGEGGNTIRSTIPKATRYYKLNGFVHDSSTTVGRESMADLWMGMYMEIDFTMTSDGMIGVYDSAGRVGYQGSDGNRYYLDTVSGDYYNESGVKVDEVDLNGIELTPIRNDLIFDFAGDDDVLVYVDDVLLLDIGGIHGVETGSINFRTGACDVSGAGVTQDTTIKALFEAAGVSYEAGEADFANTFKPGTNHTLKFFYLERGGNISDCAITFNLEPRERGGMSLTKEVVGLGENGSAENSFLYEGEYTFQLVDLVQPYDPTNPKGVTEIPYEIKRSDNTVEKGMLQLNHQTKTIDGTTYQVCRYYADGFGVDKGFQEIYRLEENGNVSFYYYPDGGGALTEANESQIVSSNNEKFYKVYDSDRFSIGHDDKIEFENFIVGTLVKVRELEAVNGVDMASDTYKWRITNIDNGEETSNGEHYGTVDEVTGAYTSEYFTIKDKTDVDIVCENTLKTINIGIRKILNNPDGTQSEDETTEFTVKYTMQYPDGTSVDGMWTLKNKEAYENSIKPMGESGPTVEEFYWPVLVPFGTTVTITEINEDGVPMTFENSDYQVNWTYEGWELMEVPVAKEEIPYPDFSCPSGAILVGNDGKVLDEKALKALNLEEGTDYEYEFRYILVYSASDDGPEIGSTKLLATDNYFTIYNTMGYTLPETGGTGTNSYILGGLLIMMSATASLLLYNKQKRRKEENVPS